ncbi:hypothetical protein HZC09_07060 [Candidatus Micrarchaeota archaeon]|nr:hypothetical protein [Candidatus Micrarchaeota archaeon]
MVCPAGESSLRTPGCPVVEGQQFTCCKKSEGRQVGRTESGPATKEIALVVKDASALTGEEKYVEKLLSAYGQIEYVEAKESDYDKLKGYSTIVAVDRHPELKSELFVDLLKAGRSVILLHDALVTIDEQVASEVDAASPFKVMDSLAFLEKYEGGLAPAMSKQFVVQEGGSAYSGYQPFWWKSVAFTGAAWGEKATAFYSDGFAGKGAAFGYDASKLSTRGKMVMEQLLAWVFGKPKITLTIEKGKVALFAKDSSSALTDAEKVLKGLLEARGESVQVAAFSSILTTDYSGAKAVAAAENLGMEFRRFFKKASGEKPSLFVGEAFLIFVKATPSSFGNIAVEFSEAFAANYDANIFNDIPLVDVGSRTFVHADAVGGNARGSLTSGWIRATGIGEREKGPDRRDFYGRDGGGFYKENNGVRGVLFGYDLGRLAPEGKVFFNEALKWVFSDSSYARAVPQGQTALVILEYYDKTKLTAHEAATKSHLESMNKLVYVVPQGQKFTTDFSGAEMIILAEYPGFRMAKYFSGMGDNTKKVGLFGSATKTVAATSDMQNLQNNFLVLDNKGFLSKLSKGNYFPKIQDSGMIYGVDSGRTMEGYLAPSARSRWTTLGGSGCSGGSCYWNTAAYAVAEGNRCVALFGFSPASLNADGKVLLNKVILWLEDCKAK